jgi:hypothetical protein
MSSDGISTGNTVATLNTSRHACEPLAHDFERSSSRPLLVVGGQEHARDSCW